MTVIEEYLIEVSHFILSQREGGQGGRQLLPHTVRVDRH